MRFNLAAEKMPTAWPRRRTAEGELPFVRPTVRTAAVDPKGRLWISLAVPYTYVYAPDGDKVRTVQFRGAGTLTPASISFGTRGQLLVTPGLFEFQSSQ